VSPASTPSPPPARLILDLSRLVYAAWSRTPKGIPRVELAYAQHFMANEADRLHFTVLDAFGRLRLVDNRAAETFARAIAHYWKHDVDSSAAHWGIALRALWIHLVLILRPWGALERLVARPKERFLYIVLSQLQLDRPALITEMKSAGNLKLVFFVHDVLPSLFPHFFTAEDAELYHRRMENASHLADVIIMNSRATAQSFESRFGGAGVTGKVIVAPLGISRAPDLPARQERVPSPYFVMLGTIEPRKNHRLMLDLWLELHRELGPSAPHLLVIGERGWKNGDVIASLDQNARLHGHVRECGRVPDGAVAQLLKGARALLLPSLAEGYGLPLAEALAGGTPVLCSDIAVFREVGGKVPDYLEPTNTAAWHEAVLDYARPDSPRREAQIRRLSTWRRPTWEHHFAVVDATLREL
jgi:glycosyltransferase involved in cell wall biosynthesis